MRVRVLYFGVLKESMGKSEEAIDLTEGSSVGDLLRQVSAALESLSAMWKSVAVAVNREYATAGTVLCDGDEVALLPPVSGGCCED